MSSTNPTQLTPSEAFWQTNPIGIPPKEASSSESSLRGWNKEAWNRKRTPAEIARMEEMRDQARTAEEYSMMCTTLGCKMYNTFDKCEHNIVRMPQKMGPILFS